MDIEECNASRLWLVQNDGASPGIRSGAEGSFQWQNKKPTLTTYGVRVVGHGKRLLFPYIIYTCSE